MILNPNNSTISFGSDDFYSVTSFFMSTFPFMTEIRQVTFNEKKADLGFEIVKRSAVQARFPHIMKQPGRHTFYIIQFITEGGGRHTIDFKEYHLKAGDVVFLSKGQIQSFNFETPMDGYMILFTDDFLSRFSGATSIQADHRLFNYHIYKPVLTIKPNQQEALLSLLDLIFKEYSSNNHSKSEVIYHLLQVFLLKCNEMRTSGSEIAIPATVYQEFQLFKKLADEHLLQNRNVQNYADRMNMNRKKLNEVVREATGKSVKEYLNAALVLEIKRHLAVNTMSIKELSYATGFDEPTNLIKFFRKHTDTTPAKFAELYR